MTERSDPTDRMTDTERLMSLPIEQLAQLWRKRAARGMNGSLEDMNLRAETYDAIVRGDPFHVLALIREIVRTETDPDILSYLAAGLLEDMLPTREGPLLDAIEAAILEDVRVADLFFDINFNGLEGPVEDRLVAAVKRAVRGHPNSES